MENRSISEAAAGTATEDGTASDNTLVLIEGADVTNAYGGKADKGQATGNTVDIQDGTVSNAYGGWSNASDVMGNTANMTGGTVKSILAGGYSENGSAGKEGAGNEVNITNVPDGGLGKEIWVFGGRAENGNADYNTISMTGTTSTATSSSSTSNGAVNIYPGYTTSGGANHNTFTIKDSALSSVAVRGAYSAGGSGDMTYNTVNVINSTIDLDSSNPVVITGAMNGGTGVLNYNSVVIDHSNTGSKTIRAADRSYNITGIADHNSIEVKNGSTVGSVNTVYERYGTASNNTLTVTGSTVSKDAGGIMAARISKKGNVINNRTTLTNSTVSAVVFGGMTSRGYAAGNQVLLDGTTSVTGNVYGGRSYVYDEGTVGAAGNSVTVTGNASAPKVYGGYAGNTSTIDGTTYTGKASAVGNSVTYDSMAGGSGIDVFGGYSLSGNAGEDGSVTAGGATYTGGNTVKAAGNSTFQYIVGGASGGIGMSGNFGNADHNTVTFDGSDGAVSQLIYGGSSLRGDANNNTVSVSHVTKDTPALDPDGGDLRIQQSNYNRIAGGYGSTNASGNTVTVIDSRLTNQAAIYGGYTWKGSASDSTLTISGSTIEGYEGGVNIYGGYAMSGTEANNVKMTISDSTITNICSIEEGGAGWSNGTAKNNVLLVTGSTLKDSLGVGQFVGNVAGVVTDNTVTVKESTMDGMGYIFGTYSGTESANNTMTLDNTTVSNTQAVYGASSVKYRKLSGTAENNTLTINGGSVSFTEISAEDFDSPESGEADTLAGAFAGNTAKNNTLTLNSTTVTGAKGVYGGQGVSEANENTLTVTNAAISGETTIAGGKSNGWQGTDADGNVTGDPSANGNKVVFSGDAISADNIYGGWIATPNVDPETSPYDATLAGTTGTADSNTFSIISGITTKEAVGGKNDIGGSASKNIITIDGGTISENLAGGLTKSGDASGNTLTINAGTIGTSENSSETSNLIAGGYTSDGASADNTVTIKGGTLGAMMSLYGGYSTTESRGNTLNLYTKDNTVKNLGYFQNMNFYVPEGTKAGETMIEVTGKADVTGASIKAGVENSTVLNPGQVINLIHDGNSEIASDGASYSMMSGKDTAKDAGFVTRVLGVKKQDANTIVIYVPKDGKGTINPDTKLIPEGRENGINTIKNAGSLISDGALSAAVGAWKEDHDVEAKFVPYAIVGGYDLHYNTGSYIDSDGMAANLGLVRRIDHEGHIDTVMPFLEYGRSNYASYLDDGARGAGHQHYTGAGVLLRRDLQDGRYYEGALRAGYLTGDSHGTIDNTFFRYDSGAPYIAAQAGAGKLYTKDRDTYDVYGKFFWSHLNGDSAVIKNSRGEAEYEFAGVNSYRTRLGMRWTRNFDKVRAFYAGIGWDYEFDSKAGAIYDGFRTDSPSVKGSSEFLEIGWRSNVTNDHPWGLDFRATGWTGKQEGGTLSATISRKF